MVGIVVIVAVSRTVEAIVVSGLTVVVAILGSCLGEPLIVASVTRRGRHRVVGGTISRIWRSKRIAPGLICPGDFARAVVVLLGLHGLVAFILRNLLLKVSRVR